LNSFPHTDQDLSTSNCPHLFSAIVLQNPSSALHENVKTLKLTKI